MKTISGPVSIEARSTRRELIGRGVALGGALALAGPGRALAASARRRGAPRVLVVGAGLAGLSCAHRLREAGVEATVIEANPSRIGGRCWTLRELGGSQVAEHGGEFIDTRHRVIRRLVGELGLELTDVREAKPRGTSGRLWFDGRLRSSRDVYPGYGRMVSALEAERRRVGPYRAGRATRRAREFDEMTAAQWLADNVPEPRLRESMRLDLASFFGLDARELSAINLIEGYAVPYPGADERFHVRGGNDQIVERLADGLSPGAIELGAALSALRDAGSAIEVEVSGRTNPIVADHVVLALPFTALREADLTSSGLSSRRLHAIAELGMGTNSKHHLRLDRRARELGRWSGSMTMDQPARQTTWDSSRGQPGRGSLITVWRGGRAGTRYDVADPHAPGSPAEARRALRAIERGVPGIGATWTGESWVDEWADDPYVCGSYAAFLPGQYTRWWGWLGRPEGRFHFAGEHTSTTSQGYLDGAVESGERAAREVLSAVVSR